jgi:hypothetical protein
MMGGAIGGATGLALTGTCTIAAPLCVAAGWLAVAGTGTSSAPTTRAIGQQVGCCIGPEANAFECSANATLGLYALATTTPVLMSRARPYVLSGYLNLAPLDVESAESTAAQLYSREPTISAERLRPNVIQFDFAWEAGMGRLASRVQLESTWKAFDPSEHFNGLLGLDQVAGLGVESEAGWWGGPQRHADFHGPWRPLPSDNFKWGRYLKGLIGPAPPNMADPHAHHIFYKVGRDSQVPLVEIAQDLLRRRAG